VEKGAGEGKKEKEKGWTQGLRGEG